MLVWALACVAMIAWSTRALGQEAQTEPLVREPASPEVAAQVEAMCAFALEALEEHCAKWSDEQWQTYVEGVRIGLLNGLTKPLGEDRVAAFEESFTALARGYEDYVPGASDALADASLSMEAMKWALARKCRAFAARESEGQAAAHLQALLEQVPILVEIAASGLREALPEEGADDIERAVEQCRSRWERSATNALTPGLKRPLTPREIAEVQAQIPDRCNRAKEYAQRGQARLSSDPQRPALQVLDIAVNLLSSLLLSLTKAPRTEEYDQYVSVLERIGRQHEERSAQWMQQQQERFKHRFVSDLLAPGAEANDRALFLLEPLFVLPRLVSGSPSAVAY